jgi:hypothetical protein
MLKGFNGQILITVYHDLVEEEKNFFQNIWLLVTSEELKSLGKVAHYSPK